MLTNKDFSITFSNYAVIFTELSSLFYEHFFDITWKCFLTAGILSQLTPRFNGHFFNVIWKCLQIADIVPQLTPLSNGHFFNVIWKCFQIADILPQLTPLSNGHSFNVIWKCLQIVDILTQFKPLLNKHFYFLLLMHGRESTIFGSIFLNWDFDGLTRFEGPWVCLCICLQRTLKTNNSRNCKFGILNLYHMEMLLETFCKNQIISLCTGAHKRIPIPYDLWTEFLVNAF